MIRKFTTITSFGFICALICGCLYRGEGAFRQIGDSDYKFRFNFMNMFAVADGRPTYVDGTVFMEDHTTPLKNTRIILKKKDKETIVSNSFTDNVGRFNMSGILLNDYYTLEIDSSEYIGKKEFIIEPNKKNWHEIIAYKK